MFSGSLSAVLLPVFPFVRAVSLQRCCRAGRPGEREEANHSSLRGGALATIALQQEAEGMSVFPIICYYLVLPGFAAFWGTRSLAHLVSIVY